MTQKTTPRGAIEIVSATKRFGSTVAVDSVNLRIPAGSYCCLLGPSGCGKTTTLRMIAGHESLTEGDVLFGNQNVTDLPPTKRGTAMMFQSYALFPHLNCTDNVAFSLKMRGTCQGGARNAAGRRAAVHGRHGELRRAPSRSAFRRPATAGSRWPAR